MDNENELSKKQRYEEKILITNVIDKIQKANEYNKPQYTYFLDMAEQSQIEKTLKKRMYMNYELQGGYDDADRKILIIYPEDIINQEKILEKYKEQIKRSALVVLRINVPKEHIGKYGHRSYLGTLMRLGIERKILGDILVRDDGADIIIYSGMAEHIQNSIRELKRFQKAKIEIVSIENLNYTKPETENFKIFVASMRLDCIIAEIAKCSRKEANVIINQERVFVNSLIEVNPSKKIKENSYITIRGKGRFKIMETDGFSRRGRISLICEKNKRC